MTDLEINKMAALLPRRALPIDIYCGLYGDTRDAIKKRIQKGHWNRGVHTIVPDGVKGIWINLEAVDKWALKNCHAA